jgi:hypothetical protein
VDVSTEAVEQITRIGFFAPLWFFKYRIPGEGQSAP